MTRRRRTLLKLAAEGGQVKADFGGRVGGARDHDAETRATDLYEELRELPTEELARRAGVPVEGHTRAALMASIIQGVAPAGEVCNVRGMKGTDSHESRTTGGTMNATAPRLTDASLELFLTLAEDAPNWSGTPMICVSPAGRGNLTHLKRAGLVTTFTDEGVAFADFTEAGVALAAEHGFNLGGATPEPNRAATHEGRDELVTEALGIAPGETLRIEVDMDRLATALEETGHPAAAEVRKRANGAEGGTMTESITAEALMEGVGEALDGVGEAIPNAGGTYYRLRMAGGKTLAYADVRKDGFRLDLAAEAVEKAPARLRGGLELKGGRARMLVTAKNAKLARDLLVWVAPKIDKQG